MKILLRLLLKSQQNRKYSEQNHSINGFTLTELLVAMIMTFLILTPLLTFVVDMVNTDRKEQLKANTEQEIQSAVDFISQDLSQAVYIYDKTGIDAIVADDFIPGDANNVPILVFWKRRLVKDSLPVTVDNPNECQAETSPGVPAGAANDCDDTYVASLVAYYQIKNELSPIWCQPSSSATNCPTRIARYEIKDGVRNPNATTASPNYPYYEINETNPNQQPDAGFNKAFDLSKPNLNVTTGKANVTDDKVLVNNIDQSIVPLPATANEDCKATLGITDPAAPALPINALISDGTTNSFYACVDTSRNIARVYLRGNAMRRIYNNATYNANNPAFFPTATAQVKGLSSPGQ